MLHNSISVDMKGYTLQLKQKFTGVFPMEFCEIVEQLLSRIIFGGCFLRENRREEGPFPARIYLLKVSNRSTRKRSKIFSKLTIKTLE